MSFFVGCLFDESILEMYLTSIYFFVYRSGFFAAASFMSFQQCRFNFGCEDFKYPPKERSFKSFNENATMISDDKVCLYFDCFLIFY